MNINSPIM